MGTSVLYFEKLLEILTSTWQKSSNYAIGLKTLDGQRVIDTAKKTGYLGFLVNAKSLKVLESTLLTEETGMR